MLQLKQKEWQQQWSLFKDENISLFIDWIYPSMLEDFREKDILECGCGGGQHTSFIAPYAKNITAVDLNTIDISIERNKKFNNIEFIEADIATMNLEKKFDIVFSIGVVHHTDNPDRTVENLKKHVKPGGKLILWVYSYEGNILVRKILEPVRKLFFCKLGRNRILFISKIITSLLYLPVYSIYRLPVKSFPYYEYFGNFRRLSFQRNTLNIFDKLNAPQVEFITRNRLSKWFNEKDFRDIHISSYMGISWRASAIKL